MTLLADVNHPGYQENVVSNWEPACSLVEDAVPGTDIAAAPYPAALAAHLPLCLWGVGEGWGVASSSLVLAQSFVLCAGQAVR